MHKAKNFKYFEAILERLFWLLIVSLQRMLRRERVLLSVLILVVLLVLWGFYSIGRVIKIPLTNLRWNHPGMRDKADKIYITVKTSTKYHKKRLAPLLVTWMQTVKPHQVCVCVCVCVVMCLYDCVYVCACVI